MGEAPQEAPLSERRAKALAFIEAQVAMTGKWPSEAALAHHMGWQSAAGNYRDMMTSLVLVRKIRVVSRENARNSLGFRYHYELVKPVERSA